MIADLHVDIWNSPDQWGLAVEGMVRRSSSPKWAQRTPTPDALIEATTEASAIFLHGYHSLMLEADIPATTVAEYVKQGPDRFVGVAGIDPLTADADDRLHEALELNMAGVTVSPAGQGFHPCHSEAIRLFEFCAREELILFFDQRVTISDRVQMEFAQPLLLDEIARQFPNLRLIIGQLGYPWIDQTLCLVSKHPNVFAETSDIIGRPWHLYQALLTAEELGCSDRLLLASGFPRLTLREAVQQVHSVNNYALGSQLPSVSRETLSKLVNRDVFAALKMKPTLAGSVKSQAEITDNDQDDLELDAD